MIPLNDYLRAKYGGKTAKICINGGFTCPNRDGTKGKGGCIFCGSLGAGENILSGSIKQQTESAIKKYEKKNIHRFIAYFQSFTGTYDSIQNLEKKYRNALIDPRIKVLAIGTRPDAVSIETLELLARIKTEFALDIWIELGLQTIHDDTARIINRCYETNTFFETCKKIKGYGFEVVAHLMFGLPGEGKGAMLESVNALKGVVGGVKFHAVCVMKETKLEKIYLKGHYQPLSREKYVDMVLEALALLPENVVVHRLVSDMNRELLIAPNWILEKSKTLEMIRERR